MRISMPRGDIKYIPIEVEFDEGVTFDFDEIYFTVKKKYTDADFVFQKSLTNGGIVKVDNGLYQIKINPEDTDNLQINSRPGDHYDFDIELIFGNDIKDTTFGEFVLTPEVTHHRNEG